MLFHEKLKKLRKQKGWTQEQLAEKINVSRQAVTKWENGEGYPEIENLKVLSNIFQKSIDELVKEDFELKRKDIEEVDIKETKTMIQKSEKIVISEVINNIKIDTIPINEIKVLPTKELELSAELYSNYNTILSKDVELKVKQNKSKITISVKKSGFLSFTYINLIGINYTKYIKNLNLIVYIPDKYMQDIEVNTISDKIIIEDLNIHKAKISFTNSTVSFNKVYTESTKINGIEGNLVFKDFRGDLDINTVSSGIDVNYEKFNNNIKMNCISSNINLDFPKDSDYVIKQNGINSNIRYCSNDSKMIKEKSTSKNKIKIEGIDNSIIISGHT